MYEAHFRYKPRDVIELRIVNGSYLEVGRYDDSSCFLVKTESDNGLYVHYNVFNEAGRIVKFKVPREFEE